MGERVTLTYTVDIDELEEEVSRLYFICNQCARQTQQRFKKSRKDVNAEHL